MPAGAIVVGDIVKAFYKDAIAPIPTEFIVRSIRNGKVESVMNVEYYNRIPEFQWPSYTTYVLDMDKVDWIFVRKNDDGVDTSNPHYKVIRKIKLLQLKRKENGYVF